MYEHSDNSVILGVDIGGSHITAALIRASDHTIIEETICRNRVEKNGSSEIILSQWFESISASLAKFPKANLIGMGFAIPGPFNYEAGICLMKGVNKYDSLYNLNIGQLLRKQFSLGNDFPIRFENDASCFGLGESLLADMQGHEKLIAVTLGTGFGATFLKEAVILKNGDNVPPQGQLYNQPYLDGIAEDRISTAWILAQYNDGNEHKITEVKDIAEKAINRNDEKAIQIFKSFGEHFTACIIPWIKKFNPDCLVIGGSIAKSSGLFIDDLKSELSNNNIILPIKISTLMENSAMLGAASLVRTSQNDLLNQANTGWRKTSQALLPATTNNIQTDAGAYNIYPFYNIGNDAIFAGYDSLASWIADKKTVVIDGYGGNDWEMIQAELAQHLERKNVSVCWITTSSMLRPEEEIAVMVKPFLGEPAGVWGTKTSLSLKDFYDSNSLAAVTADHSFDINIVIGTGAALCGWENIIYIDIPKNEIQYRMRARSITNLGSSKFEAPAMMYKRFYFVDWVVYNKHRNEISARIAIIADGQWKKTITWSLIASIREGLNAMSKDVVRARPWFEAGTWGGDWMKEYIPQLNQQEVNYAWSFELIAPENGLVLESNRNLLEISFDWLMELQTNAMMGQDAERFGTAFPIRFDFLDTFEGGNLSIQCHPSVDYIQNNFGERITQDETYYILDCKDDAKVYLGFQDDINPQDFKSALVKSVDENKEIDIEKYVSSFPSQKHQLYLIPNQTIHSSGTNNMVLEISATPYIFTFKMYDWVRLDLDGNPRPINIEHAFNNLNFSRKGKQVAEELISTPIAIHSEDDYTLLDLPTHADHFYKIERLEFTTRVEVETNNQCHVLMLVEGSSVLVKTKHGNFKRFNYAETFIIPAAAESYEILNESGQEVKVVRAFIKQD